MLMLSIVVPVYNRAGIIPATLDSILNQTYQDWECIIVDDFSTDNTKSVVQQYVEKDNRFRFLRNERKKGAQGARNTGIIHAKSDWVICFDSDNTMHPDMMEKMFSRISDDVDVVQCFSALVDANTGEALGEFNWVSEGYIHRQLFTQETYVDFNQSLVRKSALMDIGLLDEDCPSMQEWDTHIRLSVIAKYTTIKESLLDYYLNGADAITTDKKREVNGRLFILKKHRIEWRENRIALTAYLEQVCRYIFANKSIRNQFVMTVEGLSIEPLFAIVFIQFFSQKCINFIRKRI